MQPPLDRYHHVIYVIADIVVIIISVNVILVGRLV